jgi:hypothetical protein
MNRKLVVAVFEREQDLVAATMATRKQGIPVVDAFTPYAVHGLDKAMDLAPSRLSWVCFLLGLLGGGSILLFQYWASWASWPINVGGKPWNSWPAFMPVTFEVTVLLGGVGTVAAFIWVSGLRPWRRPRLTGLRVTDDRFALALGASPRHDRAAIEKLLAAFRPVGIEERPEETA